MLVNLAYIQRLDLLERMCANGAGRWVERVRGETWPWRERDDTARIASADDIFGDAILLTPAQLQQARILQIRMAKPGDSAGRHMGEAQTLVVASEFADAGERVTFVTDDYEAARRSIDRSLRPVGTGDILSLFFKDEVETAMSHFQSLRKGNHHAAWHRIQRPEWAHTRRQARN